jgi:hypothetical protein
VGHGGLLLLAVYGLLVLQLTGNSLYFPAEGAQDVAVHFFLQPAAAWSTFVASGSVHPTA